jgi:hypothetical protein
MDKDNIESVLRPSWIAQVKRIAGAVILGCLGYFMTQAESWVLNFFGWLFLVGGVIGVFIIPFLGLPRRGPCPRCQWPMETMGRTGQDMLCPMCCSYLDAENEKLFPVKDTDRIRDEPTFAVPTPWEDLRIVTAPTISLASSFQEAAVESAMETTGRRRIWEPKWPPGCCVCRKPETRKAALVTPVVKQGMVLKEEIEIVLVNIPYCSEHDDGVRMETITFNDQAQSMRFALRFRSLAYRNAFLNLNPGVFYKKE